MRRIASLAIALVALAGWLAAGALGDDSHTYNIEVDNAFGLTEGGDIRIAGVIAGSITDVGITPEKRALVTVETTGPLAVLGTETTCSSEPQSLIAEYFLNCRPAGPPLPDGGTIGVEQTSQTVQADLFQNTNREPYRDRLRLLINEFGTGLAGNSDALNEAIRRGAPALANLRRALDVLADQHRTIRAINVRGDRIISRLADRSDDVRRFITATRDAAAASAERRTDLGHDFDRLDDFLATFRPVLAELRGVTEQGTPLLASLGNAGPGLDRLAREFPAFADSGALALRALGDASVVGERAVRKGADEVELVRQASRKIRPTAAPLTDFLRDLNDPSRVVEVDARAAKSCNDPTLSCWATGRKSPTGYTAVEGLLNYAYYLTGATSQFDSIGHMLHFTFYDLGAGPCGRAHVPGDPDSADFGVPKAGGGFTTKLLKADPCVSWVGKSQPGINEDIGLPPYDPAVCPDGSNAPELCDSSGARTTGSTRRAGDAFDPRAGGKLPNPDSRSPIPLPGSPAGPGGGGPPSLPALPGLDDLLDLPGIGVDPTAGPGPLGRRGRAAPSTAGTRDLLEFLFG